MVHVEQDNKNTPLPGRPINDQITPNDKAPFISVSGGTGENFANQASYASGRTDSSGNRDIVVRASEPGKYTLIALESASLKEGTVNFRVVDSDG